MSKLKEKWKTTAEAELKTDEIETLNWQTLEGIEVKPVYSSDDLMDLEHLDTMPGIEPFLRGPRATM